MGKTKQSSSPPSAQHGRPLSPLLLAAILAWAALVLITFPRQLDFDIGPTFRHWFYAPGSILPRGPLALGLIERIALLAGISLALIGAGSTLLRKIGIGASNKWELLALSFGLGYGLYGIFFFLAGLGGLWNRPFFLITLAAGLPLFFFEIRTFRAAHRMTLSNSGRLAAGMFVFFWLFIMRYAAVPETFYDALEYHLGLPNLYLTVHKILPTPENSYSGIPALPQMLYGLTLALDRWGILASLLHGSMVLWIGIGLVGLSQRLGRAMTGAFAALAFLMSPVVSGETIRTSVGMEWALLQLCGLIAIFGALREESSSTERRAWLRVFGVFIGLAMSAKYPAWALPATLIPLIAMRKLSMREGMLVAAIAGIVLSPWIAKNIWFYGNPIYPFFHARFVPHAAYMPDWMRLSEARLSLFSLFRFLVPPDGGIGQSIGLFAACLIPLPLFVSLNEDERILAWFCLTTWVPLALVSAQPRFFIPHLLPLVFLLCIRIDRTEPSRVRWLLAALAVAAAGLSAGVWTIAAVQDDKKRVFRGDATFRQYLEHAEMSYPTPPYAAIAYINEHAHSHEKVLFYGDSRTFYSHNQVIASSPDQRSALDMWASNAATVDDLRQQFEAKGISWLLANWGEMARTHQIPRVTKAGTQVLAEFLTRYAIKEFEVADSGDRWVAVYHIMPTPSRNANLDPSISAFLGRNAPSGP